MKPLCYMRPLVELLRDGRLDELERASIEQHLEGCPGCEAHRRELARFAELASSATTTLASPTALDHRRGRMRLLQAAALLDASPERTTLAGLTAAVSPARPGWAMPAAALALATLAVVAAGRWHSPPATAAAPSSGPPAPLAPLHPAAAREDLRPAVAPEEPWPDSVPRHRHPPRRHAARTCRPATARRCAGPCHPRAVTASEHAPREAFAAGVGSMEQGNFGEAIERLGAFRKSHPTDSRSEDAAFLLIVALQRAGRNEAAAKAARDYLASYPSGYRRGEAQRIAAHGD